LALGDYLMKFYYFPPSPNTRKVHAVALHLGLAIDLRLIDLQKGEQHSPEFLQLNPTGRTPVLQDGDFILWESTSIMQYLASQVPNTLWSEVPQIRADIMRWQSWQLVHWQQVCQPLQYENFVKQILQLGEPDLRVVQQATERFHTEAIVLNHHLAEREFLVNNTLTLADYSVASDLTYAEPGRFPLKDYPHLRAWYSRIEQLPAWQHTAPRG
jgi:glutathione S-transferase